MTTGRREEALVVEGWEKESKVFCYLTAASCAHVVEEYFWPGGFLGSAREVAPGAFENASLPIIVGVNAYMIAGCAFGAIMRKRDPSYGLSMASLLFFNALLPGRFPEDQEVRARPGDRAGPVRSPGGQSLFRLPEVREIPAFHRPPLRGAGGGSLLHPLCGLRRAGSPAERKGWRGRERGIRMEDRKLHQLLAGDPGVRWRYLERG